MSGFIINDPVLFVLGLIFCLGGFIVYWFTIRFAGAYLGAMAGAGGGLLIAWLLGDEVYRLVFAAAGGLAGLVIGLYVVKKLATVAFMTLGFLAGLGMGRAAANYFLGEATATTPLFDQPPLFWGIVMGSSALGAGLAVKGRNILMILLTSFAGSLFLNASLDPFPARWVFPALATGTAAWQALVIRTVKRVLSRRR